MSGKPQTTPTPEHDNALPVELLPANFTLYRCGYSRTTKLWSANIHGPGGRTEDQFSGYGATPRAAFVKALENVQQREGHDR